MTAADIQNDALLMLNDSSTSAEVTAHPGNTDCPVLELPPPLAFTAARADALAGGERVAGAGGTACQHVPGRASNSLRESICSGYLKVDR